MIGFFDSGLGGLLVARSFASLHPETDILYLGDTLNVPYGVLEAARIAELTRRGLAWLEREGAQSIVLACNTATAALIQQGSWPMILQSNSLMQVTSIVEPTIAAIRQSGASRVGLLATPYTVQSGLYDTLIGAGGPILVSRAASNLVPLIERGNIRECRPLLQDHIHEFTRHNIDLLVLACTHYIALKDHVRALLPASIMLIAQDEILDTIPCYTNDIARHGSRRYAVTELHDSYEKTAREITGEEIDFERTTL
jgi:glutamate racemase